MYTCDRERGKRGKGGGREGMPIEYDRPHVKSKTLPQNMS